ncbi:MAG TPA: Cys-tRNA(Pro) deacylase [Pyrinomonadaceae bacterium]|nr:Cys-tRNA(Pro) deacylase [Pyrinomonadaceae bacterium]
MDYPVTPAVRLLREKKIEFEPHLYDYEERGGTRHSAAALGVDEHAVVKTLVMQTEARKALVVLMHGDREVSTKALARTLGVKTISPCDPSTAQKHTGYMVGGTSPFGTRAVLPVYVERTIFDLPKIYINGGKRGFLVAIEPEGLRILSPLEEVEVAIEKGAV